MKKVITLFLFILIQFSPLLAQIRVATSIFPLASIAEEIGGSHVEVINILPPNVSPHIFEPRPVDLVKLKNIKVAVYVDDHIEPWFRSILRGISTKPIVIKFSDLVPVENNNFHLWLDPIRVKKLAVAVTSALIKLDPDGKDYYLKNEKRVLEKLDNLDKSYREHLSRIKNKNVIFFHNAWYYLAKRYGLNTVDVVIKSAGTKPSPREMLELKKEIERYHIRVIFGEMVGGRQLLEKICKNLGVGYILLDPIGCRDCKDRSSYFEMMEFNLKQILKGTGR